MRGGDGRVKVTMHSPGYVRFRAFNLTDERFKEYRLVTEGARYVRELRAKVTPIDKVPAIFVRLRRAGFDVDAEPDLRRTLQERSTQEWLDKEAVKERITTIDAELQARTGSCLHPYQRTGAFWLARQHGALLADEQGLGKTLQILVALPANVPVLVIAPAVAKGVWRAEAGWWRPQIKVEILEGRNSFRWPQSREFLLTNYEILPDIHDRKGIKGRKCDGWLPPRPCEGCQERIEFVGKMVTTVRDGHLDTCTGFLDPIWCPGCHPLLDQAPENLVLIADEAHNIKNPKSQRAQRFKALAEATQKRNGRVWEATGTPLENQPKELYAVAKAAGRAEDVFGSWDDFTALFKAKKLPYGGYEWGEPGDEIKERLRRFMLRRLKKDVLPQLPTKTWGNHEVTIDKRTLRQVDAYLRASGRTVDDIVKALDKQELGFTEVSSARAKLATAKIPAMLDIVEDFEEKNIPLVVFSAHRDPIDALENRPGWLVITGDLNAEAKSRAADEFQNGYIAKVTQPGELDKRGVRRRTDGKGNVIYPKGVGITIQAGGVSLTLTRAWNELFVDRSWKPTANAQAEDRLVRIGQTRGTIIITLVANHPLDIRVNEVLIKKARLISQSIDKAADGSDAPLITEEDLAAEYKEIQEAIACGRPVRRGAESDEEKRAMSDLHTHVFERPTDERLAGELAEEAATIGLSDAQWKLVLRVAERGHPPGEEPEPPPTPSPPTPSTPPPPSPPARRSGWAGRGRTQTKGSQ